MGSRLTVPSRLAVSSRLAALVFLAGLVACQGSASPTASGSAGASGSVDPSASAPGGSGSAEASAEASAEDSAEATPSAFTLTSDNFDEGGAMPVVHTCDGEELSPELAWAAVPAGTGAFALIMDDPDASGFVHWVIVNLPATADSVAEGATGAIPGGAVEGANSGDANGYWGPCPPSGTHTYVFTLYALSGPATLSVPPEDLDAEAVRASIEGLVVGETELTGTYSR